MGLLYQNQIQLRLRYPYLAGARRRPRRQHGLSRRQINRQETGRSFVFAAVILISNTKKHGFGYKDMDESMGPCQCACPDRIMHLLSPLADIPHPGHTADWWARVAAQKTAQRERRQLRQTLRVGTVVTLPAPIRFPGGAEASKFIVTRFRRKTPIFLSLDGPEFHCRLRTDTLASAIITEPQASAAAPPSH